VEKYTLIITESLTPRIAIVLDEAGKPRKQSATASHTKHIEMAT
jgi:hypothetical protein